MNSPKIVAIAGGSCSGKTTFAKMAYDHFGEERAQLIFQDNYYIDQSDKFDVDGGSVNFDHPSSLDFDLLSDHLRQLKSGSTVNLPIYEFGTHSRSQDTIEVTPKPVILVDGILILTQPHIREVVDYSIFIECDRGTRFQRRLVRDVQERQRTEQGVRDQFDRQVDPMHEEFVEPSKAYASLVLSQQEYLNNARNYIEKIEAL